MLSKNKLTPYNHKPKQTQNITPFQLLQLSLNKLTNRYTTARSFYLTHKIDLTIQNKKNTLRAHIKDYQFDQSQQVLQQYIPLGESSTQISELTQYYKYYTQSSILYQDGFFKLMHHHRERRKIVEYNRLKFVLNLSDSTQQQTEAYQKHNVTPLSHFNVLSILNATYKIDCQQSFLLEKLKNKLESQLGPNCHNTIEELDKNYCFHRKEIEQSKLKEDTLLKKTKQSRKENIGQQLTTIKNSQRKKRNNSCELLMNSSTKRTYPKPIHLSKKKHMSMDNLQLLNRQCSVRDKTKFKEQSKEKQNNEKRKTPIFQDRVKETTNDKDAMIKEKILDLKERIKKEKEMLKKKGVNTNQSQRHNKKNSMGSTMEKLINRKASAKLYN